MHVRGYQSGPKHDLFETVVTSWYPLVRTMTTFVLNFQL